VRAKLFFVVFFLGVAAVAAMSIYLLVTVDPADKFMIAQVSPNGRYKAVRLSVAGGGAKPFCDDSISVMLAIYPDMFAEKTKSYEVFNAPCDMANRQTSPKFEWLSDTALRVSYAKPGESEKFIRKDIDVTKTVHMTFVARD
jgi:hypothetical protein